MKRSKWFPIIILAFLISLFTPINARADMAPPEGPPGTNIAPGSESTQVRMVAETVTLTVLSKPSPEFLGQAATEAVFTMRNLGTETETMQARFPLMVFGLFGDPAKNNEEIKDFQVFVDGKPVQTTRSQGKISSSDPFDLIPWAAFPVSFPPGEDLIVTVRYTTNSEGDFGDPDFALNYILETGAGWKDTIGSADIIVKLPYEASPENVGFDPATYHLTFVGKEVRWHLSDFEPTHETNFKLRLVRAEYWQKVLQYRGYVKKYPNNGEFWGQLGKAIKKIITDRKGYFRSDPKGEKFYQEAFDAYQKSVQLLPEDALWHYGFADLLWTHDFYTSWGVGMNAAKVSRVVDQLRLSLTLDPKNEKTLYLAQWVARVYPWAITKTDTGYDYPVLTATPTVDPETATPTPEATSALQPQAMPTLTALPATETARSTPAKNPASSPPLCGGTALLLPALFGLLWLFSKRR